LFKKKKMGNVTEWVYWSTLGFISWCSNITKNMAIDFKLSIQPILCVSLI